MAINKKLLDAILALDSYNRSYNPAIGLSGNKLGNSTIIFDSSQLKDEHDVRRDIAIGFYAIAYKDGNGNITISYRGTDEETIRPGRDDVKNAYGVGLGDPDTKQSRMAFEFYKAVAAANEGAKITVTGHSMGGGLADLVAGAYNLSSMASRA